MSTFFSKHSRNLNISKIFWACYTKNNFPIIFLKYEKPHISNQTVWFEAQNFSMRLKKIEFWNIEVEEFLLLLKADIHKYTNLQIVF